MSDRNPTNAYPEDPSAQPARKAWHSPRVIVSEVESTEAGALALPEIVTGVGSLS